VSSGRVSRSLSRASSTLSGVRIDGVTLPKRNYGSADMSQLTATQLRNMADRFEVRSQRIRIGETVTPLGSEIGDEGIEDNEDDDSDDDDDSDEEGESDKL